MTERYSPAGILAICLWLSTPVLSPVSVAGQTEGDELSDQAGGFRYSDDWKVVSAPPPPGPYSTVNVDPRVPGQDITRPVSVPQDLMLTEPASDRMPDELDQVPPPGAGRPADTRPLHSRPAYTPPPPAGAYGRQDNGRYPAPAYSAPGYTDYQRRQTYPGYGQGYNRGYGYGYSYPGQYAPYRQQDIQPPFANIQGR